MDDKTVMTWGKHKGEALVNIPAHYFIWLGEQEFIKNPKGQFNKELKKYIELNEDVFSMEVKNSKK